MGVVHYLADKLVNVVAKLGTDRDKAAHNVYLPPTLTPSQAINAYRSTWLARKIVDIPAKDGTRRWRAWQAKSEQITAIESEEKRLALKQKVLQVWIRARLRGGAAIFIGTGDSDLTQPLDPSKIGKGGLKYLTVMDKKDLTVTDIERDPTLVNFGMPKSYRMAGTSLEVHPTRLAIFQGNVIPTEEGLTANENGWSDSILCSVFDTISQADGTMANVASLVFEAKVDVISVPNLMEIVGRKEDEEKLINRFTLAAMMKGNNGTLVLDGGDGSGQGGEKYDTKTMAFGGMPDLIDRFLQAAAGAADIPVTRLLGQSPAGQNSTGESDLRNYYDRVQSEQELEVTPALSILDECLIRSALGSRPPEVFYNWNSLWQPTQTELIANGKVLADTLNTLNTTNLFPAEALSKAGANALTESGVFPGLEAAIDEFGSALPDENDEQEPPDTEN